MKTETLTPQQIRQRAKDREYYYRHRERRLAYSNQYQKTYRDEKKRDPKQLVAVTQWVNQFGL